MKRTRTKSLTALQQCLLVLLQRSDSATSQDNELLVFGFPRLFCGFGGRNYSSWADGVRLFKLGPLGLDCTLTGCECWGVGGA